jgi:hypothetical protein
MTIIVKELGEFSGKFTATFTEESGKEHILRYNLEEWQCAEKNGFFGGNYIQILLPELMHIYLNTVYKFSEEEIDTARKIYRTLVQNGWKI